MMSVVRVYTIFISGNACLMAFPSLREMARVTFFSLEKRPWVPGSNPPWPGSMTMVWRGVFSGGRVGVLKEVADQAIAVRRSQKHVIFVLFIRGFWRQRY